MVCYYGNPKSCLNENVKIDDDSVLIFLMGFMNFISGCVLCIVAYSVYSSLLSNMILYCLYDRSNSVIRDKFVL